MRRIKIVLALAAVMAAMMVAFAGPAVADDRDHRFFAPFNRFAFCDNFLFNCGFPFGGGGILFGIDQEIQNTGDITLNTTVS